MEKTRTEQHKHFSGVIYPEDFNTSYNEKGRNYASRIESDWKFDANRIRIRGVLR